MPMSAQARTRTGRISRSVLTIGTSTGTPVCAEPRTFAPGPQPTYSSSTRSRASKYACGPIQTLSPMTQRPSKRPWR